MGCFTDQVKLTHV
jgi:hypothetical protein